MKCSVIDIIVYICELFDLLNLLHISLPFICVSTLCCCFPFCDDLLSGGMGVDVVAVSQAP